MSDGYAAYAWRSKFTIGNYGGGVSLASLCHAEWTLAKWDGWERRWNHFVARGYWPLVG